ncbi:leucine-rich repeat domain-containing protein [Streptomyces virginiae]|uniref:leucine-rich repeat domain-containing protein n=1 Tax=Streptomyces virginiae TaxID=1961 RepID=UPI002254B958|nr:leucine-rich repeat domain-containing protein [Streptomyces virginiae]MCX5176210.1 hypothetical protein [Streptomyces virginiae]
MIARLDPSDLVYSIRLDEQLRELERLGLRPSHLDVRSGVSLRALAGYADRNSLTELAVSHPTLSDLDFLSGQSALASLDISDCPKLTDLSAIGGLPIRHLNLSSVRPDLGLEAVAQLGELEHLRIEGLAGATWSARALPAGAPLHTLVVAGEARPAHGLEGIGSLPELRNLVLNPESGPVSTADWREILAMESLARLTVSAASFETLPTDGRLPGVDRLILAGDDGQAVVQAAIRRLPAAFPRLTECQFVGEFTATEDIDLAPLAELRDLLHVHVGIGVDRIQGLDLLPSTVRLSCL